MMIIDAHTSMHFQELNQRIRDSKYPAITVENCNGQRYIGAGLSDKHIVIKGTPGNALGAYLNGATIEVSGNAQDATGDTMNEGNIIVHGNAGDATGYGMRGGKILIEGNSGYRSGIHMKEYKDKFPIVVMGGCAGSFLGEYQAGGVIIVLGLNAKEGQLPVGNFCGTGMHGGKMFLRTDSLPEDLPPQVVAKMANKEDLASIEPYIDEFCIAFDKDKKTVMDHTFYLLTADTKNPYKQLYTNN